MNRLLAAHAVLRSAVIWLAFMVILWSVFAVGWLTHREAWNTGVVVTREAGWQVLWFILAHNLSLLLLIAAGNVFVRFGNITPGLVILLYQAISIGWVAGTNGFMEPFPTMAEANAAFLRIGLWETTAYVLVCAVTLPKSLYVADGFPARKWVETRNLKDLRFKRVEAALIVVALLCLLFAALAEAFLFLG